MRQGAVTHILISDEYQKLLDASPAWLEPVSTLGLYAARKKGGAGAGMLKKGGGDEGIRTLDLCVANAPLSHLSYIPTPRDSKLS
jgi:hypothetical protein